MISVASSTSSLSEQHKTPGVITSCTIALAGSLPIATARVVISRSVIIPTSSPPSRTGSDPTSKSLIFSAALCNVSSAWTVSTRELTNSLSCIEHPPTLQAHKNQQNQKKDRLPARRSFSVV